MKKLLYHLYATLEQANINHENPDNNAVIKFVDEEYGCEYTTTVGDIYRLISHIEDNLNEGEDIKFKEEGFFDIVREAQEYIDLYFVENLETKYPEGIDTDCQDAIFIFRYLLASVIYIEQ